MELTPENEREDERAGLVTKNKMRNKTFACGVGVLNS
jgi:hypothetical protein